MTRNPTWTRTLSAGAAYRLVAAVIGLALFASLTPSALYGTYSELWRFSPLTLTLVYGTYAFGVLATLLLAGRSPDEVGRRPVLLAALGALAASTVLFMVAGSVAWLFAARAVQGLATGAALSAASAALLDLHPRRDPVGAGLTNAVCAAGGISLGMLVSSSLVQLGDAPRVLPYAVLLVLFAVAFAGALAMPEPVAHRRRFRLTPERPGIPAGARAPFAVAALAAVSSWSIGGLFFSLGPELAARLFGTTNVVVAGSGIVALAGSAAIASLALGRTAPWIGASAGSLALAGGMALVVTAAATGSSAVYLPGSVLGGAGFGLAYMGGLRSLGAAIPPGQRARVMSAFFVVAYTALSVPAIVAGAVVGTLGLPRTFELFGAAVIAIALAVAVQAWRTRPGRAPAPQDVLAT